MPAVQLQGTQIFYRRHGYGIPCLIMHGGFGLDHTYLFALEALGDMLDLVFYDHRGHGRSGRPPVETMTLDQFCADADALCDHLELDKVAVLGHSGGGFIAQKFALGYPHRVSHLLLVATGTTLTFGSPALQARLQERELTAQMQAALTAPVADDAGLERLFRITAPLTYYSYDASLAERLFRDVIFNARAFTKGCEVTANWNSSSRLPNVRAPTLIVAGAHDVIFPPSESEIILRSIPGSTLIVLNCSGHHPYAEEPAEFETALRRWFGCQRTVTAGNLT